MRAWIAIAALCAAGACGTRSGPAPALADGAAGGGIVQAGVATQPAPAPGPTPAPVIVAHPSGPPPNVKIVVRTFLPGKLRGVVTWGKKNLGMTPVTFERPQGSGPIDLVVRAEGYFPVHVRAYTDRNDTLNVEMTRLTDRMKLYGARKEPPPEAAPAAAVPAAPVPVPAVKQP